MPSEILATGKQCGPANEISLLDYFAGRALNGFLSDSASIHTSALNAQDEGKDIDDYIATAAYQVADAMIRERKRRNEHNT